MYHSMTTLYIHLPYFHVLNSDLFILQSTQVLSFYINVVLTRFISFHEEL